MKVSPVLVALALMVAPVVCASAESTTRCSTSKEAGQWAFTSNGTIVGIGPASGVGLFTADSAGNISGGQTRSLNGDVAAETLSGTITVNADCTATARVEVFVAGVLVRTTTLSAVYDQGGNDLRAIFSSIVLPDGTTLPSVITLEGKRLSVKN